MDNVKLFIAGLIPRWLVYWCSIRLISHATTGKYSSTITNELNVIDALKRWEDK